MVTVPSSAVGARRMSVAKALGLIAVGYALSVAAGIAIVVLNELFMPADIAEGSGGMVAFGDMILFVLATGFFGLVPTWFLLKLALERVPRALLTALLLLAAIGPMSWLAVMHFASGPSPNPPTAAMELLGPLIAFVAIPRIVVGPVLLVVEGLTFVLARQRAFRALLIAAMLMDLVPMTLYAFHMARAVH